MILYIGFNLGLWSLLELMKFAKGDEVYTRAGKNCLPASSEGWTIHFIERSSRYWVSVQANHKDELLFQRGTQQA